MEKVELI